MSLTDIGARATKSAAVRAKLPHPVVDADAHMIEYAPLFFEHLKDVAGKKVRDVVFERLENNSWEMLPLDVRRDRRLGRPTGWGIPTINVTDRATAMLPALFRARMDDFGLDFSIVHSTLSQPFISDPDEELRRAKCRALNSMAADMYRDHADRMTPVATIPAHTPEEAIDELEHAVRKLGFKAVAICSNVRRPVESASDATWMDTLCMESPYDYDPVWAKCVELKVAVQTHTSSVGHGSRVCSTMYTHNHVGSFAAAGEAFAKALVLSGVTKRFPALNFGFMEGGVSWATELYAGLVAHCGKRHPAAVENYNPANLDRAKLADLLVKYGAGVTDGRPELMSEYDWGTPENVADPDGPRYLRWPGGWRWARDEQIGRELAALGITRAEDLRPLFEPNFYYGCEADDPLVSVGFDRRLNPFGSRLQPMFSSDIGHWDVTDMNEVLEEAYELVERGLLDDAEFKTYTFDNTVSLHGRMNPEFFKGTTVEAAAKELLGTH